ncbi:MAG: HAD family phosphatase [Alphaproteobacteria bacterium]|nr:HAD family phosphatase [Alphaproteobacteria bacterium]
MKKLIIWDFDGVIADTENLWVQSRLELLKRDYQIDWDFATALKHIGGRSDRDKKNVLRKMGLEVKDELWQEAVDIDMKKMPHITLTPHIKKIFERKDVEQCVATGGTAFKTAEKIKYTGLRDYFPPQKIFTIDMVEKGKPEPDLFLLAAKTMGYRPQEAIVVEDSVVGVTAAKKAGMQVVAFVKYNTEQTINEIKKLQPDYVTDDMRVVENIVLDLNG